MHYLGFTFCEILPCFCFSPSSKIPSHRNDHNKCEEGCAVKLSVSFTVTITHPKLSHGQSLHQKPQLCDASALTGRAKVPLLAKKPLLSEHDVHKQYVMRLNKNITVFPFRCLCFFSSKILPLSFLFGLKSKKNSTYRCTLNTQ